MTYRGPNPIASPEQALERDLHTHQSESLWAMSPAERERAMWAGRLSLTELCEWTRRAPSEVPRLDGEFAWIVMATGVDGVKSRCRSPPATSALRAKE